MTASGLGDPTYVLTGWIGEGRLGEDDRLTARLIERIRVGEPVRAAETARAVAGSQEAAVTRRLGPSHTDPRDIELATRVDAFRFAMEARQRADGLELTAHPR